MKKPTTISPSQARDFLVGHHGLRRASPNRGHDGVRSTLEKLRCFQLDPLDPFGTNADLVALARVDGLRVGDVYDAVLPGGAFEHFFKERCLLPPGSFPYYRDRQASSDWFQWTKILTLPTAAQLDEVESEVAERGPLTPREMTDRGPSEMKPGAQWWSGRPSMNQVACEFLKMRCRLVVVGRSSGGKRMDLPDRALGEAASRPPEEDWGRWAVLQKVEAAGLLTVNAGPQWSLMRDLRTSTLISEMVGRGELERVVVEGSPRKYLAPPGFRDQQWPDDDGRMRILGPLDPLIWDRKLVQAAWDFEYIWEVYKPKAKRRWGWYVCPILHEGRLVARFEGRRDDGKLRVDNLWVEDGVAFDQRAWAATVERHSAALG